MVRLASIDFETMPIVDGAARSPVPVGVAIFKQGGKPRYLSWGHASRNNTTREAAVAELAKLCKSHRFVMHNAQFDLRVLWEHFGLWPKHGFDDTKIEMYLVDPRHKTLSLKPLADELLDLPPLEEREMHDWLDRNYPPARRTKFKTKYTAWAPGEIAEKYAKGDVLRTMLLHQLLQPMLDERMREAYQRELDIVPLAIDMEAFGVRVDVEGLERAGSEVVKKKWRAEERLRANLGNINFNSRQQLAQALVEAKYVGSEEDFLRTPKNGAAVGIPALRTIGVDDELVQSLELVSKIGKLVGTYIDPWLSSGGTFHPYFNPTRVDGESGGTRTGRFSSNFQQIPKEPFGDLPWMRRYVLPDPGEVLVWRDYSQQELRVLAHYEEGALSQGFNDDPDVDIHDYVGALIKRTSGLDLDRKSVKICNFLTIYGGGAKRLADQLGVDEDTARTVLYAHRKALPGVGTLQKEIEQTWAIEGEKIRTWGGRQYTLEREFEYKGLNLLVQGSSADQTKEAMLRYDGPGRILMQVHDELVLTVPPEQADEASEALRWAMEEIPGWHVPMRSTEKRGERWG